jgi:hypothetical protein
MVLKQYDRQLNFEGSIYSGKWGSVCSGKVGSVWSGKWGSVSAEFPGKYWPTNMNEPRCNECKKKIDFLPINETLTSLIHKLSKKLGQEYPGHEIKTLSKSVLIKGFLNKPVSLELLPEREHFRIVFKLEHSPARLRKKAYDDLSEKHFFTIRDSFPKDSVKMGNEMKRIKIDLNNTNHPEFFGNCDDVTSNTIDLIQNGIKTIVTKLS